MMVLTRKQRVALKRVYDRAPMYREKFNGSPIFTVQKDKLHEFQGDQRFKRVTYRDFRRTVIPTLADCVMVPWCGMWLGIEKDGYTHS